MTMGGGTGAGMMPPAFFSYAAGLGLFSDDSVTTDAQGAFEIMGLEPGKVRLYALHSEYAGAVSEEELEIVAGEPLEGVVLELVKGGGAYGTVVRRTCVRTLSFGTPSSTMSCRQTGRSRWPTRTGTSST
mgnify:CR=1 FL=1